MTEKKQKPPKPSAKRLAKANEKYLQERDAFLAELEQAPAGKSVLNSSRY